VTFKWYDRSFYAILENIPPHLFAQYFTFEVQIKERRNRNWIAKGAPIPILGSGLRTPKTFKLNKFFKEYFPQVGFMPLNSFNHE
jgi:hypothetical protein